MKYTYYTMWKNVKKSMNIVGYDTTSNENRSILKRIINLEYNISRLFYDEIN